MNEMFYERCKNIIAKLDLTYEQGIAREVILNQLEAEELESKHYLNIIHKIVKLLDEHDRDIGDIYYKICNRYEISSLKEEIRNIIEGE